MSSDAVWTDDTHQIIFFKKYKKNYNFNSGYCLSNSCSQKIKLI